MSTPTVVFRYPVKLTDALDRYPSIYDAIDDARETALFVINDLAPACNLAKVREACAKSYLVNIGAEVAREYREPALAGARIGLHVWFLFNGKVDHEPGHYATDPETGEIIYPEYRGINLLF